MLVAFDFDGTLSEAEMTVLLGHEAGVADEIAQITDRAMNDDLSYAESLYARADRLADLPAADADAAFDRVELRPGATDVVAALRAAGHHVAVLTGGFERGVERALSDEGVAVDTLVANRLPVRDGRLTGGVEGPLVEGTKDEALQNIAAEVGVGMAETVAVGDGANDRPMLEVARLAVGYEPKPAVEPYCDVVVASMAELRDLLARRDLL
jgi:phosphoserine phosphatase